MQQADRFDRRSLRLHVDPRISSRGPQSLSDRLWFRERIEDRFDRDRPDLTQWSVDCDRAGKRETLDEFVTLTESIEHRRLLDPGCDLERSRWLRGGLFVRGSASTLPERGVGEAPFERMELLRGAAMTTPQAALPTPLRRGREVSQLVAFEDQLNQGCGVLARGDGLLRSLTAQGVDCRAGVAAEQHMVGRLEQSGGRSSRSTRLPPGEGSAGSAALAQASIEQLLGPQSLHFLVVEEHRQ